ncbi:amino acid ABC transporter substrate-binding protein, PAAT family [Humidesulfovibrio mexicanus]|uniref:Amino acid ABC transporter substrate-binding protein, PAAT family n=1 Tax=Humidesulfovibrio mexicanus TaxID=147047 RepID=A0A238YYK2_9BACT|nr:basic amino acid ABC transporter substrate-binding protein [Humidesulfovibrio mexicanus]SNR76147.1 amino acid ABC transporter substrate-binding protein, PAAT family [Humidesulfovibrio mexicanus]
MKRLFKSLLVAAAVSVMALGVVGCGEKKEEAAPNAANATAAAPAPKTIVFASDATYPPMQYTNDQKEIVGFEVDVIKAVAEKAGFKAEFKNVAWDGIFAGLAAGKYDAISSSVSITDERKATMDFSDPIIPIEQMLVVAKDNAATDLAALKGKSIGAQIGTTSYLVIKDEKGFKAIKTYDEVGLAMEDLVKGSIQAVVADSPVAVDYTTKKYADKIKIAATLKSDKVENIGIAVKKGNQEVIDLVNKGLAAIKADGTFDKIKEQHQMK